VTEERLTRGIEAVEVGQSVSFSKTVAESDVYLFAGVSGDLHPMHVDEEYGKTTRYGRRIAHGALLVAYMSATSTRYLQTWVEGRTAQPCISYGYDRIRFIRPTFIGDTIRVDYRISEIDPADEKAFAQVTCTNQRGEIVAAATHILKFV
jgi:3-hydroxybutyryl-CoA dehydratase